MSVTKRTWTTKTGQVKSYWLIDVYIDGNRIRKGGFATKKDAVKYLSNLDKKEQEKANINKDISFNDAALHFMKYHAEIHCKPSTIKFYSSLINNHLLPYFGRKKAYKVRPEDINELISNKMNEGLSKKTINELITLTSNVFNKMIENNRLVNNPVSKVKRLKLDHHEMQYLTTKDVNLLLDTTKKYYPDFYPLLCTSIFTGMRKGELLALTWQDINFKAGKINVNKSIYLGNVTSPKTHKGIRKIDMPDLLIKVLKEHKLKGIISEKDLVFCNQVGNYLDPDNIVKRRFEPCLRKAGLDVIRFHDLRHTYASMLIMKNVPIKYIQTQLGHASIQVTMDRYGHIMPETHAQAVKILDEIRDEKELSEENKEVNQAKQN